jgi:L-amino acid N-acyltransferase YncA
MKVLLRDAHAADAAPIARLHLDVRRATYTGMLPQAALDADSFEQRLALWERRLADPARRVIVAERDRQMVGFACAGPMPERPGGREPLPGFDAYLESIYIDPATHGEGTGRAILSRLAMQLAVAGFTSLALHAVSNNPARGFYEHLGARFI